MPGAFSKFWEYIGLRLGFSSGADRNAETPPLSTEQRDEQAVFLAAIKAAPLDDAPRLIYADWLEEQDGASRVAHARFIRASCAFSQRWLEDGAREAATPDDRLLEAWGDEWETEFPAPAHPFERHWRRGFPELIVSQWAPDAGHLSAACWPCLTSWHFGPFQSDDRERFEKLARHRELEHLEELNLVGSGVSDVTAQILEDSPALARLKFLGLQSGLLNQLGVEALTKSAFFGSLQSGWLSDCRVSDESVETLLSAPKAEPLSCLDLGRNQLSDASLQAIVRSASCSQLKCLELYANHFTTAGAIALAQWPGLNQLRVLDLCRCGLTDEAALAITESPYLESLTHLDLSENPIGSAARAALRKSPRLAGRVQIALSETADSDDAAPKRSLSGRIWSALGVR